MSMKRILYFILAAAATLLFFSCSKDSSVKPGNGSSETVKNSVTISVDIPKEGLSTKISFAEDESTKRLTKIAWEDDDVIDVYDGTTHIPFTIVPASISADGKTASFTGNEPAVASSYVITYNSLSSLNTQMQNGDGTTDHLGYKVVKTVSDYKTVSFAGATTQSSVLQLRALLPDAIKNSVTKVIFKSNLEVFNGQKELTVALADGKLDANNRLDVYATIPEGDITLSDEMELLIQFQVSANAYDKYTAYRTFASGTELFKSGGSQYIGINCSNIKSFANASDASIGSATNPYLVGDQHQMQKINDEMAAGETKYFKLVDDIDMTGATWNMLNYSSSAPYDKQIDFDGNNKTVSNLGRALFYVLKGSVKDLILKDSDVTDRGALAEFIQASGNIVTNVTVSNGTVNSGTTNTGGLIGNINNGTSADVVTATITNCTVSDTNVSGTGVIGGLVGFADAKVSISGCSYTNGTVTATARFCGGLLASTGNYDSVISDCHVENATVSSTVSNNDFRAGGFIGQLQIKATIKGCSVGTSAQKVNLTLSAPTSGKVYNSGGFVGTSYGTITKNDDGTRSTAYVNITAGNTATGSQLNLGGFVGFLNGTVEYSDANVTMSSIKGTYVGGFVGYMLGTAPLIRYCTESGTVTGNNYAGGFVGVMDKGEISNCTSSGTLSAQSSIGGFIGGMAMDKFESATLTNNGSSVIVTSSGSNVGGFGGSLAGTYTSNYATGDVTSTKGSLGGFAGQILQSMTASFSRNYATGNVSGGANCGGLIGYIGGNLTMTNCYATGNVGTSSKYDQKYGGLVGFTTDSSSYSTNISISNCYSTGNVEPSFAGGGLIGRIGLATVSVSNCAAWGATVKAHNSGLANWSSAAVVGVTFPTCTLTGNYRKPGMAVTAYWGTESGYTTQLSASFDHADVSSTHPLTDSTGTEMEDTATAKGQTHYPQYPYHGHYTSETSLSTLASTTLGWSSDVWDFSGPLPLLK